MVNEIWYESMIKLNKYKDQRMHKLRFLEPQVSSRTKVSKIRVLRCKRMCWADSKGCGMNQILILGVLNGMVKVQGEPWLVHANKDQELGLRSLGDQVNLHVSLMGDSPSNMGLKSEWYDLNDPPSLWDALGLILGSLWLGHASTGSVDLEAS